MSLTMDNRKFRQMVLKSLKSSRKECVEYHAHVQEKIDNWNNGASWCSWYKEKPKLPNTHPDDWDAVI